MEKEIGSLRTDEFSLEEEHSPDSRECVDYGADYPSVGLEGQLLNSLQQLLQTRRLRQEYVEECNALKNHVLELRENHVDTEAIARKVHGLRRAIGVKYKLLTPAAELDRIYERNENKYGDRLGPTIDYLRLKGKSWEEIIESASRTGGKDLGY